jgi:Na+/proline symporter/signal transduction histidine kinase
MNIDSIIFLSFLLINIFIGLYSARNIKTMKEYAVGNGNFSTITIAATIVATFVSGSDFFTYLSESYSNGLYFIWAAFGDILYLFIIAFLFAPRLGEFIGKLSIADAMGGLYGNKVRVITSIAGCISSGGLIAVQLKVAGMLLEYGFGVPSIYGVTIAAFIVGLYTAFGGIKSVTFTDTIQLFTFGTIIPTLAFFIFGSLESMDVVINTLQTNELFNYKEVFDFSRPKSFSYLLFFIFVVMPGFTPAFFQRMAMAKNTMQIRKSFIIAGIACLFITLTMSLTGVFILSADPGLNPNNIAQHILTHYSYVGLKGLVLVGVMAMVMSTVDSFINATSVILIHDFCGPLGIKITKNELKSTRVAACIITIFSLFLTLTGDNLLQLIISTQIFYLPVVTMPFILAVFGFRTTSKSVLIAMGGGFLTVIISKFILGKEALDSVVPGILANILFLFASHYLLKQPGGWIGTKDETVLVSLRQQRKRKIDNYLKKITNFNFFSFLERSTPKKESIYVAVSFFCIIATYAVIFTLAKDVATKYAKLIDLVYPSMLFTATALLSYPLWPNFIKASKAIVIVWNFVIFYILICASFLFVLISNFASIQLTVFMINLMLISILLRWQLALSMIIFGVIITVQGLKSYLGMDLLTVELEGFQFKVGYLLLITSGILVAFLRPKQEEQELHEVRQELFEEQMHHRDDELVRSLKIKSEFLNNISHEIRIPITGITSLGQSLYDNYNNLDEEKRRYIVKTIAKSSQRLESLMTNILDLSKLSSLTYKLNIEEVNLSELVYESIDICKKLHLNNKEIEFISNIDKNILVKCDRHYIKSSLDNLIINAIKYTPAGKITITLNMDGDLVNFSIKDDGIGIPKDELYSIFAPFTVSSKTHTSAGGRGIGLALCKKALEIHGGKIWAQSDGENGSTLFFTLPI